MRDDSAYDSVRSPADHHCRARCGFRDGGWVEYVRQFFVPAAAGHAVIHPGRRGGMSIRLCTEQDCVIQREQVTIGIGRPE